MTGEQLSTRAQAVLERLSRVIEADPDTDTRTIRQRAGTPRQIGDAALERLLRGGFVERHEVNAEWRYRSVKPYRANTEAPGPRFSDTHGVGQGGGG
jgi:hypothetical protein